MKAFNLLSLLLLFPVTRSKSYNDFAVQHDAYDAGLFTPLEDLNALSSSEFTRLGHTAFPNYGVRIKKSDFCDGTVAAHTGYIDIEARHIFFYFFESRSDPEKDDVVFWTNGGPGGSSSIGLFMELGPCRVLDSEGPKFHKESWNDKANVFFLDQPIGVGFSFADYGEFVTTTEEAAKDVAAFVAIFFQHFTKFQGRGFHLSGESYAGRYLPVYASAIYDQNAYLVEKGMTPVNLTSVMIGNGFTEPTTMMLSFYDMGCTSASVPPILDISTCVRMKTVYPRCKKWMKEACVDSFDGINCLAATNSCNEELGMPFVRTGRNPYDLTRDCEGDDGLCYSNIKYIGQYLDLPEVREKLGVDPHFIGKNFSSISWEVNAHFEAALDSYHQTQDYIGALLERNIRVLIYVGTYDMICNWVGNEAWTLALQWTGQDAFAAQPLKDWFVDGKPAGKTRSSGMFTFATVEAAGHMVPYDKPKESLEMVNRWLAGQAL